MWSFVARSVPAVLSLAVMVGSGVRPAAAQPATGREEAPDGAARARPSQAYGQLPLSLEANRGQSDASVDFVAHGRGYSLLLNSSQAVMQLRADPAETPTPIGLHLLDADGQAPGVGLDPLPGTANYFLGSDPAQWHTDVPTYARVQYSGVYPGIDLVYYGNQGQLENDFVVAPRADPGAIRLAFDGTQQVDLTPDGDLVLHTAAGDLTQSRPVLYQETDGGRETIDGGYVLGDQQDVSFWVGAYDTSRPLTIDPVLAYSTYLGGGADAGTGLAVDTAGSAYIVGLTSSSNFPTTPGAFQTTFRAAVTQDTVFVSKLNPTGTALVYSTYLGGSLRQFGTDIAVDASGNAFVTGLTASADFPTTPGAFQPTMRVPSEDAFVSKLNPTGTALVYSTFLGGGNSGEFGTGIALDAAGNAYVVGQTSSIDFPITPGAFKTTLRAGDQDAFVSKLNPGGSALAYSTYLGGSGSDTPSRVAVDGGGNAYVVGTTSSLDFPTTPGVVQPTPRQSGSAFVTKLNPTGTALVYSTYLGGNGGSTGDAIAIDATGNTYVVGNTLSTDFPTTAGAFRRVLAGEDAFVAKLNATGTALIYSTLLGGSLEERAHGIAIDAAGNAYVAGQTTSRDFPTTPGAVQPTFAGGFDDAFVTKLNATGSGLIDSSYLAGSGDDIALAIATDPGGNAYVTGETTSVDFPTTPGALQPALHGVVDAFVAKIATAAVDATAPVTTASVNPAPNGAGFNRTDVTVTLTAADNAGGSGVKSITFSASGAQTIAQTTVSGITATVAITAEGATTLSFFATDNAGNQEAATSLVIRIDKTAPEARVQFDPVRRDIVVLATDTFSGVPAGPIAPISVTPARADRDDEDGDQHHGNGDRAELRTFLIQDAAGNTLRLVLSVRRDEHQLRAQIVSLQINGAAVITPPQNRLRVEFEPDRGGKLQQEARVGDGKDRQEAKAEFDARDNQTRIELERNGTEQKVTRPGLVLLALTTNKGVLQITF